MDVHGLERTIIRKLVIRGLASSSLHAVITPADFP
jgi:hypothetical protein